MNARAIVGLALLVCPREFRQGYQRTMHGDVLANRGLTKEVLDILKTGASLRAERLAHGLIYAVRSLASAPLYSCVAIATIAIVIAANVAVASVLEAVVMRSLPFPNADRLVFVTDGPWPTISAPNALRIARDNDSFSAFAIRHGESARMRRNGRPVDVTGWDVTPGYFSLLGASAELGGLLTSSDERAIVISGAFWRDRFSSDPHVIGRIIRLGRRDMRIIGVLPASFRDPSSAGLQERDYWELLPKDAQFTLSRDSHTFDAIARLRSGVSLPSATSDVRRITSAIAKQYPAYAAGTESASALSLMDVVVGPVKDMLWLLYGAVIALLAIACVNVGNLTLARVAHRRSELAMRCALGAGISNVAALLAAEACVLAAAGAAAGIALSIVALRSFNAIGAQLLPRWNDVHIDGSIVLYTLLLIAVTTLLAGWFPAVYAVGRLGGAISEAGRSGTAAPARRLREILVCAEIALAVVVAIGAALLVQSFVRMTHVDTGYNAAGMYFVSFSVPDGLTDAQTLALAKQIQRNVAGINGVTATALAGPMPYTYEHLSRITIPGRAQTVERVSDSEVSPEFFSTLSVRILRGRTFTQDDTAHSQQVAVVDELFARRYFGTLDVVGKIIKPWRAGEPDAGPKPPVAMRTIVGVVGSVRRSLSSPVLPTVYLPISQVTIVNHLLVRAGRTPAKITRSIDAAFAHADMRLTEPQIHRYEDLVAQAVAIPAAATQLLFLMACIALLLALAGIYAVTAWSVGARMREFGIRKAIGARSGDIVVSLMTEVLKLAVVGVLLGLVLAAFAMQFLQPLLFQTSPFDPLALTVVVALFVGCAALAALFPALRAVRVQPAAALRYE